MEKNESFNFEKQPLEVDLFSKEFEEQVKNNGKIYRRKIEEIMQKEIVEYAGKIGVFSDDDEFEDIAINPGDIVLQVGRRGERKIYTPEAFAEAYNEDGTIKEQHIQAIENPYHQEIKVALTPGGDLQKGGENCFLGISLDEGNALTSERSLFSSEKVFLKDYELVKTQLEKDQEEFVWLLHTNHLYDAMQLYKRVPELAEFMHDSKVKEEVEFTIKSSMQYSNFDTVRGFKENFDLPEDVIIESLKGGLQYPLNKKDFSRIRDYIELFNIDRPALTSIISEIPPENLTYALSEKDLDEIFNNN